jgi:hypothetical protein
MTARSDTINNNWGDSPKSVLHIYKELIAAGLRIWVFRSCSFPYTPQLLVYIFNFNFHYYIIYSPS